MILAGSIGAVVVKENARYLMGSGKLAVNRSAAPELAPESAPDKAWEDAPEPIRFRAREQRGGSPPPAFPERVGRCGLIEKN